MDENIEPVPDARTSRRSFIKAVGASLFAASALAKGLIRSPAANASVVPSPGMPTPNVAIEPCDDVFCVPEYVECLGGVLYVIEVCWDFYNRAWFCGDREYVAGCC